MLNFALNHMTVAKHCFADFIDLAADLGCMGIELRNDLDQPLFDGRPPEDARAMIKAKGLRLVGLSQVYPFNSWNDEREKAVQALIDTAQAVGAETISLIPRNDGAGLGDGERQANLRVALKAILPMLQKAKITALVEPLGFLRSTLRSKQELVDTISAIGGAEHYQLVHDTFHHTLAGRGPMFPDMTGIVHISGVVEPALSVDQMEDEHRVLVDGRDRLGNIDQIADLLKAGYDGPISYECFAPQVHAMKDPYSEIKRSIDFISSQVQTQVA